MEGGLVPLSDARLPRARASRRDVRHCRRPLRDRLVARDEPGRAEGRRGRSGPARWSSSAAQNMGDIFRRNSFNLGLHVVQSPEAVADAQRRRRVQLRPGDAPAAQRDAGQDLHPGAAVAEGRGDPPQRRHLRGRPPRVAASPSLTSPSDRLGAGRHVARAHDDHRADRVGAPRRQGSVAARISGRARRCASTRICCRRPTARRRSRSTPSTRSPAASTIDPRQAAIANDHFVFTGRRRRRQADRHRPRVRAAARHRASRTTPRPATGSFTSIFPSRACHARPVHPGRRLAQPRLRRVRGGRHRRRLDDARLRLVDRLHLLHAGAAAPRGLSRPVAALGGRQGHRAGAAAAMGREAVAGDVGRARRRGPAAADGLPQHHREHDGGGRSAERHLRARRDHRRLVSRERHRLDCRIRRRPRRRMRSTRSTRPSTSPTCGR